MYCINSYFIILQKTLKVQCKWNVYVPDVGSGPYLSASGVAIQGLRGSP